MNWNDPSDQTKPKIVDDLYDTGVIIAEAGPGTRTYMRVDRPGEYFDGQQRPVSERDAQRAGFNVAYYRAQKRAADIKRSAEQRADQILATDGARALMSEQDMREERTAALRAQAAKLIREEQRKVQAAADKALTRDILPETPTV